MKMLIDVIKDNSLEYLLEWCEDDSWEWSTTFWVDGIVRRWFNLPHHTTSQIYDETRDENHIKWNSIDTGWVFAVVN